MTADGRQDYTPPLPRLIKTASSAVSVFALFFPPVFATAAATDSASRFADAQVAAAATAKLSDGQQTRTEMLFSLSRLLKRSPFSCCCC